MSCGVCCRLGSDLALMWLWCKLAAAVPIQPLAWELPYALGVTLKRPKKKKKGIVTIVGEDTKELEPSNCWWGCKMVQLLNSVAIPQKLNRVTL